MMLQKHEKSFRDGIERRVFLLNSLQIDYYWEDIAKLMTQCPGFYDFYTPEWLYRAAKSGNCQIWGLSDGTIKGIVVTQILVFPKQKVFEVLAGAGVGLVRFFDDMEEVFEFIAADCGCQTIAGRVRPGIERLLRKKGVVKVSSWVSKPVGQRSKN